jgi:hypothetical protein
MQRLVAAETEDKVRCLSEAKKAFAINRSGAIDRALPHLDRTLAEDGASAPWKTKTVFHFRNGPAAGRSQATSCSR